MPQETRKCTRTENADTRPQGFIGSADPACTRQQIGDQHARSSMTTRHRKMIHQRSSASMSLCRIIIQRRRTSRITRSERLSDHCPRDTRGLGVHPLVRWCFGAARERPSSRPAVESLQNASSRAKFVRASSGASVEPFRFFRLFRGCKFDRASIGRTGKDHNRERHEIRESGGDEKDSFEARPKLEPGNGLRQQGKHCHQ